MYFRKAYLYPSAAKVLVSLCLALLNHQCLQGEVRFPIDGDRSYSRGFGGSFIQSWCGFHLAVDIGVNRPNIPVYPMTNGVVRFAGTVVGYTVVIEHPLGTGDPEGSLVSAAYYHMKIPGEGGIALTNGQNVNPTDPIGYISPAPKDHGNTAPHLHFGIRSGPYQAGKDPRTEKWFYPGYTTVYKDGIRQCDSGDLIHHQILGEWIEPLSFVEAREQPIPPPATGTVSVNATLDAAPWSGAVSYNIVGPQGSSQGFITGHEVPHMISGLPPGPYAMIHSVSGGPPNSIYRGVSPRVATQELLPGQTITFTLEFSSITPPSDQLISFGFTGVVNQLIETGESVLGGAIPVGTTVSGTFSYPSAGEDLLPHDPQIGQYHFPPGTADISMTVAARDGQRKVSTQGQAVLVGAQKAAYQDAFSMQVDFFTTPTIWELPRLERVMLGVALDDLQPPFTLLVDDSLPTVLDLSQGGARGYGVIQAVGSEAYFSIGFILTSLTSGERVQWLSFVEGDPELPGDNVTVGTGQLLGPEVSPKFGLGSVVEGLTLTVFANATLTALTIATNPAPGSPFCVHFGSGIFPPSSSVTVNGVTGNVSFLPQSRIDFFVSFANQGLSAGCQPVTRNDLFIKNLQFGGQAVVVDAVAVGLGQNAMSALPSTPE